MVRAAKFAAIFTAAALSAAGATATGAPDQAPAPASGMPATAPAEAFWPFESDTVDKDCREKYPSTIEQLSMERSALGGDTAAQLALARCSWPLTKERKTCSWKADSSQKADSSRKADSSETADGSQKAGGFDCSASAKNEQIEKISDERLIYAFMWARLTTCWNSSTNLDLVADGGATSSDNGSSRLSNMAAWRLKVRYSVLYDLVAKKRRLGAAADAELMRRMAGLGAPGLVRLAQMNRCALLKNDNGTLHGIWTAAKNRFKKEFGYSSRWSPENELARFGPLSSDEVARSEQIVNLLAHSADSASLGEVGDRLALSNMAKIGVAPIKYALRAYSDVSGFGVNEVNETYGPATRTAVETLQDKKFNVKATGWLTPAQTRSLICKAATERVNLPSMYWLGIMYLEGYGFAPAPDKSIYLFETVLNYYGRGEIDGSPVPEWVRLQREWFEKKIKGSGNDAGALARAKLKLGDSSAALRYSKDELCPKWVDAAVVQGQ